MTLPDWGTIIAIGTLPAAYVALFTYWRWRLHQDLVAIKRRIAQGYVGPPSPAWPDYVLHVDDTAVACTRPDRTHERIAWSDLDRVTIVTNGDGPYAPDIFWVMTGKGTGCLAPWGATGEPVLLERLQALPGFDNAAVVRASGSTAPAQFECWRRS